MLGDGDDVCGHGHDDPSTVITAIPMFRARSHGGPAGLSSLAAVAFLDGEEEVLGRASDSEYGLAAYPHTEDPRRIYRSGRALQYGMVAVDRAKVDGAPIPSGGMKQSGLGREGARLGMEA